uniref:uncharacterized protein LOC120338091 n=1 Tax=Styela clava TaxID=7725 RepID=UPI00193AD64D|nr:uncharacterized protein LOC120338091 [Styela clava]
MSQIGQATDVINIPQIDVRENDDSKVKKRFIITLFKLGITEVILGIISVLLGVSTVTYAGLNTFSYYRNWDEKLVPYRINYTYTWIAQGIWCGLITMTSGILAIAIKYRPSQRFYNVNIIMSVIAATSMGVQTILSVISALMLRNVDTVNAVIALHGAIGFVGLIGIVICIVHSAYGCAGVCCLNRSYVTPIVYIPQNMTSEEHSRIWKIKNGPSIVVSPASTESNYEFNPCVSSKKIFD